MRTSTPRWRVPAHVPASPRSSQARTWRRPLSAQNSFAIARRLRLPIHFIDLWVNRYQTGNAGDRIAAVRKGLGAQRGSALKLLSHFVAVDVPDWVPRRCASYLVFRRSSFTWTLAMPPTYEVLRSLRPEPTNCHNNEYLGDIVDICWPGCGALVWQQDMNWWTTSPMSSNSCRGWCCSLGAVTILPPHAVDSG